MRRIVAAVLLLALAVSASPAEAAACMGHAVLPPAGGAHAGHGVPAAHAAPAHSAQAHAAQAHATQAQATQAQAGHGTMHAVPASPDTPHREAPGPQHERPCCLSASCVGAWSIDAGSTASTPAIRPAAPAPVPLTAPEPRPAAPEPPPPRA